jgi:hypothetical protein
MNQKLRNSLEAEQTRHTTLATGIATLLADVQEAEALAASLPQLRQQATDLRLKVQNLVMAAEGLESDSITQGALMAAAALAGSDDIRAMFLRTNGWSWNGSTDWVKGDKRLFIAEAVAVEAQRLCVPVDLVSRLRDRDNKLAAAKEVAA